MPTVVIFLVSERLFLTTYVMIFLGEVISIGMDRQPLPRYYQDARDSHD